MDAECLECPICLGEYCHQIERKSFGVKMVSDIFNPPIMITNCGHSFCKECIAACSTENGIECPKCRFPNPIVADLARNYLAEQMIEFINEQNMIQKETQLIKGTKVL